MPHKPRFPIYGWIVVLGLSLVYPVGPTSQAQDSRPCAPNDRLHRVSQNTEGGLPNGSSWYPTISADGRYVTFASEASDLVPHDTNGVSDIFLYDRQTCETTLVTVGYDGTPADGPSNSPDISEDGRWIAFDSTATNLVPDDTNGFSDVFVYDRATREIALISVTADGVQGVAPSAAAEISADGQWVVFGTSANNLVPTDHDACALLYFDDGVIRPAHGPTPTPRPTSMPCPDILAADRRSGDLIHVSLAENQMDEGEGGTMAWETSISADGRYVVFSTYDALIAADTNYNLDIYMRDLDTGKLTYLVVGDEYHSTFNPVISGDGQTIVFTYSGGTPDNPDTNGTILAYDVPIGQFSVVLPQQPYAGANEIYGLSISSDGRLVSFVYNDRFTGTGAYIYDRQTHLTTNLARRHFNEGNGLWPAHSMMLTGDGQFVVMSVGNSGTHTTSIEVAPSRLPPLTLTFVDDRQSLIPVTFEESGPVVGTPMPATPPGQHHQWVLGDWDGDGLATPGAYADNGVFYWINMFEGMDNPAHWSGLWIGLKDRQPVAGRFGYNRLNDCIGVMDWTEFPPDGKGFAFYFTCDLSTSGAAPPLDFQWYSVILPDAGGFSGSYQFVADDWDDDGWDGMAFRRGATIVFTNEVPRGSRPVPIQQGFEWAQYFGTPESSDEGWLVAGDWNRNDTPSFGVYYPNGVLVTRDDLDWNSGDYTRYTLSMEGNVIPLNP